MKDIYPHANTIVCIEESKLLKEFEYDILYNAKGLQETLDELNSINYFHSHKNADIFNHGTMLDRLTKATFDLLKEIAPTELIWRIFALYYDIHNMKLVVKEKFFSQKLDHMALDFGSYTLPTIRSASVRESDNILRNEMLTKGFFEALRCKDIYDVEFILDKTYFRTLRKMAEQLEVPEILDFVKERIDLYNISAYFQSLAAGSPEGYLAKAFSDQGNFPLSEWEALRMKYYHIWESPEESRLEMLARLDVLSDNYLITKTRICKLMAFSYEPICAYFFNKFMEIKNIRIMLTGKESNSDISRIQKRMRIPYEL